MYQAIGQDTNNVYASGSKADCIRTLNSMYDSYKYQKCNLKINSKRKSQILTEPILIVRVVN